LNEDEHLHLHVPVVHDHQREQSDESTKEVIKVVQVVRGRDVRPNNDGHVAPNQPTEQRHADQRKQVVNKHDHGAHNEHWRQHVRNGLNDNSKIVEFAHVHQQLQAPDENNQLEVFVQLIVVGDVALRKVAEQLIHEYDIYNLANCFRPSSEMRFVGFDGPRHNQIC